MAEPLFPCPDGWKAITLEPNARAGYILKVETGGTPVTSIEEYWDGEIPWLTPKEITGLPSGSLVSHTERTITEAGLRGSGAKLLAPGSVLLTKRAPVGIVVVNTVPMTTNQGFLNFVCGPNLRPQFLAYWFEGNRKYLDLIANGSTYPELYKGDLNEFIIAIPSLEIQDRIIAVLNAFQFFVELGGPLKYTSADLASVHRISQSNSMLLAMRNELLPLLLSGSIDLSRININKEGSSI